jgi:hypothetical protein
MKGAAGDRAPDVDVELSSPSGRSRGPSARPPERCGLLQHEVRGDKSAAGLEQAPQQWRGHRERRVGNHVVGAAREAQRRRVGAHHRDIRVSTSQRGGPGRVQFDGDHPVAGRRRRSRHRAVPGADVEHQRARRQAGGGDEMLCPVSGELEVAPRAGVRHGGGPSSRRSCRDAYPMGAVVAEPFSAKSIRRAARCGPVMEVRAPALAGSRYGPISYIGHIDRSPQTAGPPGQWNTPPAEVNAEKPASAVRSSVFAAQAGTRVEAKGGVHDF